MESEGLAFKVFPVFVLAIDHREENQPGALEQDAHGRFGLLNDGVGCSHAQVSLSIDHSLNGQFFFRKEGDFIVHATRLGTLQRNHHRNRLSGEHVSECNPDLFGLGMRTSGQRDQQCGAYEPGDQLFDPSQ